MIFLRFIGLSGSALLALLAANTADFAWKNRVQIHTLALAGIAAVFQWAAAFWLALLALGVWPWP